MISKSTFLISLERIETITGRGFYSLKHCNVRSEFACPVNCSMSQRSRPSDCSSSNLGLLTVPSVSFLLLSFSFPFCLSHFVLIAGLLRIQLKLNTALLSTVRVSVCSSVTGVTSHISHIYKGINAMLIIRGPIKPYIF